MFDLIFSNGQVIDGTGTPAFRADVGVEGARIAAVGNLAGVSAHKVVDATGLHVCPGFIDLHSHTDLLCTLPEEHKIALLKGRITQGITTEINGNCGVGVAPLTDSSRKVLKVTCSWFCPDGVDWQWDSYESYLGVLENRGLIANVGTLVPHGPVRVAVMGLSAAAPSPAQLAAMQTMICDAMEQGAFGMSTGLIYPPGMYSRTDELVALAQEVGHCGGIYTSHVRGSSDILFSSVEELLEIGRRAEVHVHHSHHGSAGERNWWKLERTLAMEDEAREAGQEVTCDVIPYNFATTGMGVIFPPWALEDGRDALLQNLLHGETRKRIRHDVETVVPAWPPWEKVGWSQNYVHDIGWENIHIASTSCQEHKEFEGVSLSEYAKKVGKECFEAAADLLVEEGGNVSVFLHAVSGQSDHEEPLVRVLSHPASAIITDAYDLGRGKPHPAAYGGLPHVFQHFVKDRKVLSMEEAVRKMTSLPAAMMGIPERGVVREGLAADLVVLDAAAVRDRATHEEPRRRSQGIEHVVVNGAVVVENQALKPVFAGKVLVR